MSKIALTPNATGTGVFTISSPATNTDRTLTLPDITGTLVSTDASGNVGIGTSSPDALLDVSRSGNGQIAVLQTSANRGFSFESQSDTALQIASVQGSTNLDLWANTLTFSAGATERMRIDSTGNVGIGTSSPAQELDVNGQVRGIDRYYFKRASDNYSLSALARWDGSTGSPLTGTAGINTVLGSEEASSNVIFAPSNTERMRIDSSGNVLVGTTTIVAPSSGHSFSVGNGAQQAIGHNGAINGTYYSYYSYNGSVIGSITQSGTTSVAYNTSSDYRLKTDAQPMTGASDRVQALKPVNFEWISSGDRVDGFLAHEAQAIVPEAVTGTKDAMRDEEYEVTAAVYEDITIAAVLDEEGNELEAERTEQRLVSEAVMGTRSVPDYQGIDQSKLVPLLTAALQEALTEISALKVRVAALEAV